MPPVPRSPKTDEKRVGLRPKSHYYIEDTLMTPESKNQIFFFLTLFAGIFILYPFLDYQSVMATGDHGRDLYAAQASLDGQVPYKNYFWIYGPLMPYYYAFWFKLLGAHIQAVLAGQAFLSLIAGTLIYLVLTATTVSCGLALTGALWFWVFFPGFFHTYNHIGGLVLLLVLLYLLILYLNRQKTVYLFWSFVCVFFLSLVKINFGVTALCDLLIGVAGIDFVHKKLTAKEKKIFYILIPALLLPGIVLSYLGMLQGLPGGAMHQALHYLRQDQSSPTPIFFPLFMLLNLTLHNMTVNWPSLFLAMLIIFSTVQVVRLLTCATTNTGPRAHLLVIIGILILFYISGLHEFLVSGIFYRLAWVKPFGYLLIFIVLNTGTKDFPRWTRLLLYATLFSIIILEISNTRFYLNSAKKPSQYLALEKGKVFLGNDPAWLDTTTRAVSYLKEHLRADELFFALPYEPLYYFLTDKRSPTRQMIFFDYLRITTEQEKEVLDDLERKNIRWVLLSNRQVSTEAGLGTLGKTYCPLIGEYIGNNFETVAEFGDWTSEPGWAWNHGVKILKRRSP